MGSYFNYRTQRVVNDNKTSSPLNVTCGVGQGSILRPLIYSIYTSSLCFGISHSSYHLHADDAQLYISFNILDISETSDKLNMDLDTLVKQSTKHPLRINESKTKSMVFGPTKSHPKISINVQQIPVSNYVKTLGFM